MYKHTHPFQLHDREPNSKLEYYHCSLLTIGRTPILFYKCMHACMKASFVQASGRCTSINGSGRHTIARGKNGAPVPF
jgi:hypothetical protein